MKILTLGERVMLSRRDLDMSQQDLADRSGVSRSHIKSIELGKVTNVGLSAITAIADALGVSLAYLLGMSEDPLTQSPDLVLAESSGRYYVHEVPNPGLRRLISDVVESFEALPPDSQVAVYNLIQHMRRISAEANDPAVTPPAIRFRGGVTPSPAPGAPADRPGGSG